MISEQVSQVGNGYVDLVYTSIILCAFDSK